MAQNEGLGVLEAAENVDSLVCTEMRTPEFSTMRGLTRHLYQKARQAQGGPLTYLAAKALRDRVAEGDYVFLLTGAGALPWRPHGETDGPLGAASLAGALAAGQGAVPVYVSHEAYISPIVAASQAAGVSIVSREMAEYGYWRSALSRSFPLGPGDKARQTACELLDEFQPKAVIAIEKLGPNYKGVVHGFGGLERSADNEPFTDEIVVEARRRGILTIGIGDGGNEVGYGKILEAVQEIHPFGKVCRCPCGGGVACAVETDVLVHGAVSNWASYGVAACLAMLGGEETLLHDAVVEERMLLACAEAGAEGGPGYGQPWVDKIPSQVHIALVTMLHGIVMQALASPSERDRPW